MTGREVDQAVIKGLLDATETGNRQFKTFVNDVFVTGTALFDTISRNTINTGMEEKKKTYKKVNMSFKKIKKHFG